MLLFLQRRKSDGLHVDFGGEPGIVKGVVAGILWPPPVAEVLEGVVEAPELPVLGPFA